MNNGEAPSMEDEAIIDLDPVSYTALRLASLIWYSDIGPMTDVPF